MTEAIRRREVEEIDDLYIYDLDVEALREEIEIVQEPEIHDTYSPGDTSAMVRMLARARLDLPEHIFHDLDTTGGNTFGKLVSGFSRPDEPVVKGAGESSKSVSFKGVSRQIDVREDKVQDAREEMDQPDRYESAREGAIQAIERKVRKAVRAYNDRARERFLRIVGDLDNWKTDEVDTSEVERLKAEIDSLREQLQEARQEAHAEKKGKVLQHLSKHIADGGYSEVPDDWIEEAERRLRDAEHEPEGRRLVSY